MSDQEMGGDPTPDVLAWVRALFTPTSPLRGFTWWYDAIDQLAFENEVPPGQPLAKPLWDNLFGESSGPVNGPDCSNHQGTVDWAAVRESGASFAFVKATEGYGFKDRLFGQNWSDMAEVGLVRGAYHFARVSIANRRADREDRLDQVSADAVKEAEWFVSTVYPNRGPAPPGDLPLVLDIEWDKRSKAKPHEVVRFCTEFSDTVERLTGRPPIIYTGPSYWRYRMGKTGALADHVLWLVEGYRSPAGQPKRPIAGWDWTFHQYTNKHIRPDSGRGLMDWNAFRGTLRELALLAGVAEGAIPLAKPVE